MPSEDLQRLPQHVQSSARVHGNGEVSQQMGHAADAIRALADLGQVILGLDIQDYGNDGAFAETPWSIYEPHEESLAQEVEAARAAALLALDHASRDRRWHEPGYSSPGEPLR